MAEEESRCSRHDTSEGSSGNLLVDLAVWAGTHVVIGGVTLWEKHKAKKWKKLSSGVKVGDAYEGVLSEDGLKLEVPALEGVCVGFALADKGAKGRVARSGAETLRACWGAEAKLENAISIAHENGLGLRRDLSTFRHIDSEPMSLYWQRGGGILPKVKMVTVPTREEIIRLALSDFSKESRPIELKVAYIDTDTRTVRFICEALECAFYKHVDDLLKGVEVATREHVSAIAQKTIKGEIVRVPDDMNVFDVRLDGIAMHRVFLAEPAWDDKMRHDCLATGSFNDYICENWLTKHDFVVKEHEGPHLIVRSATIDKALGVDEASAEKVGFQLRSPPPSANRKKPSTERVVPRIIVDASNVVRADEKSSWRALRALLCAFENRDQDFILMFDANIYYVLEEKGETAGVNYVKSLEGKYKDRVRLVPAGNRADEYILLIADQTGNHILSRDRYQDAEYRKRYPWLIAEDFEDIDSRRLHKFDIVDSRVAVPDLGIFEKIDYDM